MADLDLSALPSLDDLSGDLIGALEDHADELLGLGIQPDATAEMIGRLADDLLDWDALLGGPWGAALEAIDGPTVAKAVALGQAIVRAVMDPERRADRQERRADRKSARQARRATRKAS